ncbi:MAG: VanZ family protein [Lachnospiraceae bacterium]|nr:VanZ family protein [Lachnospiraceae bacterium]
MARKNEVIKRILIVVILLTLAFIWGHSMMPGDMSGEESGFVYRVLSPVLKLLLPDAWVTEHLVRKIAHFSEYGALGVELTLYASLYKDLKGRRIVNLICSGLIVAFLDETIQIFSGRGTAIADVWIDLFGFTTGFLIVGLIRRRHKKSPDKKKSNSGLN